MEPKDWYDSHEKFTKLLKQREEELIRMQKDIEEIKFCLDCYAQKVGDYKPEEKPEALGVA